MPRYADYSIPAYGAMVADARRTTPYVEAMRASVRPGDVVLDIGTGSGIFAFVAARLGASRVYAIEPDDAIEAARQCASDNAGSDRIVWLQDLSTEITLPERVDLVVADLHGTLPFFKRNIQSLVDARRRHLKPGGRILPARDRLFVAPASSTAEYRKTLDPWRANDYGVDLRAARGYVVNSWWRADPAPVSADDLIGAPACWGEVDYERVETPNVERRVTWTAERAGVFHGYYVWFDSDLGNGIALTNSPLQPAIAYGRGFFPLEDAVETAPGDRIDCAFSLTMIADDPIYRWRTRVVDAAGAPKARYDQSTFNSRPFKRDDVRRAGAGFVPRLGREGRIDREVLDAMARAQPLGEIAAELLRRHPDRFPDEQKALARVASLSARYAE